jgi:hypothetical protein
MAEAPCLLNPTSGEIVSRANQLEATQTHSTQRGIRNTDTFDKLMDVGSGYFAMSVAGALSLAYFQNAISTDSSEVETGKNQQVSDTAKGVEEDSAATVAATLGNIASAIAPLLVGAAGTVSVQTLAAALPAVITAAQSAAKAGATA